MCAVAAAARCRRVICIAPAIKFNLHINSNYSIEMRARAAARAIVIARHNRNDRCRVRHGG